MKATDFLEEWNRTHTSSPTFQDILDWAEQKQTEEMKELNNEWMMTLAVQKQKIITKACEWLRSRNILTEASIEGFRKVLEE